MPSKQLSHLPTFVAIECSPVLTGHKRAAGIHLDTSYFEGVLRVFESIPDATQVHRAEILRRSREMYKGISANPDSATVSALLGASERLRGELQQIPEIQLLRRTYPGEAFVVPEWIRTETMVKFGPRIYFCGERSFPSPAEIIRKNVEAVATDEQMAFEQYQGDLFGYPECCVEYFQGRPPADSSPEWQSISPLVSRLDDQHLDNQQGESIEDLLSNFFETPRSYAYFAREFFPEPDCSTATRRGVKIYDSLSEEFPEQLVRDYFRLNYAYGYAIARTVECGGQTRPSVGTFGREHLYAYLPLQATLSLSRYN